MLELIDLVELEVIVAPELGVASSHGVGGFQQVVAEITVTGLYHSGILCLKVPGLVLCPDKAGVLGHRSLSFKATDIADLSNDAGRVDLPDAWDGGQGVGDDFKLLFNGFLQHLDLTLQGPHGGNGDRHGLVDGVIDGFRQPVGASGSGLYRLCRSFWVSEATTARRRNESSQGLKIAVGQLVHRFKGFH